MLYDIDALSYDEHIKVDLLPYLVPPPLIVLVCSSNRSFFLG